MSWFNGVINEDYLHPSVRTDPELSTSVENAEYDLFNYFTEVDDEGVRFVALIGYDEVVGEADPELVEAVERTLGEVVSFRLRNAGNADGVQSIQQGQRSVSYFDSAPGWDDWPINWHRLLIPFDDRIVNYMI